MLAQAKALLKRTPQDSHLGVPTKTLSSLLKGSFGVEVPGVEPQTAPAASPKPPPPRGGPGSLFSVGCQQGPFKTHPQSKALRALTPWLQVHNTYFGP